MQTKHSSQMASLIGKMLEQKNRAFDKHFQSEAHRKAHDYQMLAMTFLLSYLTRSIKQGR